MRVDLYTVQSRGRPNELHVVGEGRRWLGLVPPFWALWNGLWIMLAVTLALLAGAFVFWPALFGALWLALAVLSVLEGAEIERLDYRLRGWREVGVVEARSPEGAEELFLTGQSA